MRGPLALIGLLAWAVALADDEACLACHSTMAAGAQGHPMTAESTAAASCTACHQDALEHAAAPGSSAAMEAMLRFESETVDRRSSACRGCHDVDHTGLDDVHAMSGVACDGCHDVHGAGSVSKSQPSGFQDLDPASALCAGCHEAVLASFAHSERHRLAEGAVSCVSCHDPHDLSPPALLGQRDTETCGGCHDDKVGPFVFEHGASRVEGCLACHEPHGSPNRHLLTHQREGELCYSCHVVVPQFHVGFGAGPPRFDENTVCTNCHTTIHGSNFDRDFLR